MSSISSLLSQYFQLPGSTSATADDANTNSAPSTSMPSLADALSQAHAGSNNGSSSDSAFTLDLSPTAQSYLQQVSSGKSGSSSNSAAGGNFLLSPQQQQKLNSILEKYKDASFDQDTYDSIQNDLQAAGLAPQQLAAQDQMRQFNAVTELVDALSGKSSGLNPMDFGNSADESANANGYMQRIVDQWQNLSGTTNSSAADSTAGGSTTA